ncbi:polypeptide N-acetylgalactosaminyltransferase 5-like [Pecten maximus]|uniref:polypeptide N-acetylgalactosaminyltransferase 5-like n=1 Tax=Pecten maximus TaxID=6579 RepID=UPI0014582666|nr:polypeptide N-acetylgalactosaminyltransferase 5-like [Pecten maximus]XP_033762782.1 polypeptide N-acetylgalactosaminyltransferase 5-like [Pecten maximus]
MSRLYVKKRVIKLCVVFSFLWCVWVFVFHDGLTNISHDDSIHKYHVEMDKSNEIEDTKLKSQGKKKSLREGPLQPRHLIGGELSDIGKEDHNDIPNKNRKVADQIAGKADIADGSKEKERDFPKGNVATDVREDSENGVLPSGPGELGEAVNIDAKSLSPEEKKIYNRGWKNNAFNEYVSDMISLDRSLNDTRDPECKTMVYSNLPDASVIVTFHNEAWSVLLRSVHSIINRTPPELLKEVILVDDFSDMPHLHAPLEEYMSRYEKVQIVRASKREGLIRSRLLGYKHATGTVLVYLDSHIECAKGWIEPLLDPIARDKTISVTPVIDVIDFTTFRLKLGKAKDVQVGGFDWSLVFNWHVIPETEKARRDFKHYLPARSPTMAGGLFAISREYFTEIGTYDEGMNIWGAENLEISFRIWMCGGTLLTAPCSHVGHIFRRRSPYTWPGKNILLRNNLRLAEVWLDDFKTYYYSRLSPKQINGTNYGDVSDRKALRKRLNCKSFSWFLKNVFPEIYIPGDSLASGEIRNKAKPICLDGQDKVADDNILKVYPCHQMVGNQFWLYMKDHSMRRDTVCFDHFTPKKEIHLYVCHGMRGNQEWEYREDNTIYHVNTQKCITLAFDGQSVSMEECRGTDNQLWVMDRKPAKGPSIL